MKRAAIIHRILNSSTFATVQGRSCSTRTLRAPALRDVDFFESLGDRTSVIVDEDVLKVHNLDWKKQYRGKSEVLVKPGSVEDLAAILKYCSDQNIGVVPQGGNTGLVGGSVPISKELIVSTERLNKIHGLDRVSGILKCQSGCTLSDLQAYASDRNHLVPLDLGAKGSCQIGGNISTNAGGQYYYRYGSLAANVLGIQAVLASGRVLDLNFTRSSIKDNTGYKLHQLFIGSEGTLGIVTGVSMVCPRLPLSRHAVFIACESFDQAINVLDAAKEALGETLAAFEWMDRNVVELLSRRMTLPIREDYGHFLLVETHGCNFEHDQAKLEAFLERSMRNGDIIDGVQAQDLGQVKSFWEIRESCNPTVAAQGYGYKYDVSLPLSEFEGFCQDVESRLNGKATQSNWGHLSDGNLHLNVTAAGNDEASDEVLGILEPFVFEAVLARGGSISAEHGLGQSKNKYLPLVHESGTIDTMRNLKAMFDPAGILNPGKFLP